MLTAWSVTEVVRYSFFATALAKNEGPEAVPGLLRWLRYNLFFVLYPLGIASECWLVYLAIGPAKRWNLALEYVLKTVLFVYIPGRWNLFVSWRGQGA